MKVNTANSCHRYGQQSLTKEIHERIRQELALAEQKALNEQQEKLAKKDQEIAQLQNQIQQFDTEKELAKKEVEQTASQSLLEKEKKCKRWKINWPPCAWNMKISCKNTV